MKIVLLSGNSGWRLWPLSNEARSKQFLKLLQNDENERESMIQRIYRQVSKACRGAQIYVVTGQSQVDSVQSQLENQVKVIVEPERRGTFPAAAAAAAYFYFEEKINPEETVLLMPVDTFADEIYFEKLGTLQSLVLESPETIFMMGIKPTYPSAKYGYLVPESQSLEQPYFPLKKYEENPTEEKAERLMKEGALWNSGAFACQLKVILNMMKQYGEVENYGQFIQKFSKFPKGSFDHEILKNNLKLALVPYKDYWKDLGTWNTLTEEMSERNIGFAVQGEDCQNTHVINELSIPVLTLGTKNLVVAASPDGILVSDKHRSSYMQPYVQNLENRPMYEERRWGEYKVLDYNQYEDKSKSLTKHLTIHAGKSISYQKHHLRDEIWTIVDGEGELLLDGQVKKVHRGDVAYIVKGQLHALRAVTDLQFIEVQIGLELAEDDIERFDWKWE